MKEVQDKWQVGGFRINLSSRSGMDDGSKEVGGGRTAVLGNVDHEFNLNLKSWAPLSTYGSYYLS